MAQRKRRVRLVVRTQPSQGWCTGSIPVRAAHGVERNSRFHDRFATMIAPFAPAGSTLAKRQPIRLPARTAGPPPMRIHPEQDFPAQNQAEKLLW